MSMQLQSKVLMVVLEKIEPLTVIKNEPPESKIVEIGIDDSSDKESIPDIKDIEFVLHELSEDLIKRETVSENLLENNHKESVETQIFVKTENNPFIKSENITQSENLNEIENTSDGNVMNVGTDQEMIKDKGSNENFNAFSNQTDKLILNFSKNLYDISLRSSKAKQSGNTDFSECDKPVKTTSYEKLEKDKKKRKVIEVPMLPVEPYESTILAKAKLACTKNKSTHKQNKKRYCCEKCTFISENRSYFKRHKLSHKTKTEADGQYLKYCCDKCKYKTCWLTSFKRHKLNHLKPGQIPYFYCYHCSYKCKQKYSLKTHIFSHFKRREIPFHCYICDFMTLKRDLIIEHFKKHPKHHSKSDKTNYKNQLETYTKYHCDKCKYKTYWSTSFRVHEFTHLKPEEIQYFYCYHCSYKSNRKHNLKVHELTHKTEAKMDGRHIKYRCDKCKYKTFRHQDFKKHKLIHFKSEKIQYFYCYHCSYKFNLKQNLKVHIFKHFKNEDIPFHCYICDFVTLKRDLIMEHFKKHPEHHSRCDETDYKNQLETYSNYRCDKCKYKSYWRTSFNIHKLKHLKPEEIHYFYCYHCSYKSKQKINLQTHIFRHFKNEDVPFHCYICDFTTRKRNLIIEHFKKHPKHHSKCDETDYKNQLETYTKIQMR